MRPVCYIADIHLHNWSSFSSIDENGVNTRLEILLKEIRRANQELMDAGGHVMVIAGDLFHVRGSIAPSVLNPALDTFREVIDSGTEVIIIPGNHDLEGKHTDRLGSAVTALENAGCTIIDKPTFLRGMCLIPWYESIKDLRKAIDDAINDNAEPGYDPTSSYDLVLHAPIDGVITGLPDHGLKPEWLASLGFKRVFAGHYHNHKEFPGGVFSIGALAHHSWSDVGSKAGFLIVSDDNVRYCASHAPSFIDITDKTDPEEIPLLVDGHYVRIKTEVANNALIQSVKDELMEYGAKGVVVQTVKAAVLKRENSAVTSGVQAGMSLVQSVSKYIELEYKNDSKISDEALSVMTEAGL